MPHYSFHFADETSFEAGVKVQIHSQEEPSFIDQLGFGVAPGFQTFVSCQEQRVQTFAFLYLSKIILVYYNLFLGIQSLFLLVITSYALQKFLRSGNI